MYIKSYQRCHLIHIGLHIKQSIYRCIWVFLKKRRNPKNAWCTTSNDSTRMIWGYPYGLRNPSAQHGRHSAQQVELLEWVHYPWLLVGYYWPMPNSVGHLIMPGAPCHPFEGVAMQGAALDNEVTWSTIYQPCLSKSLFFDYWANHDRSTISSFIRGYSD